MNVRILTLAVSVLFLMSFTPSQQTKWEKLGSKKVNYGLEKDVIPVGLQDGGEFYERVKSEHCIKTQLHKEQRIKTYCFEWRKKNY